MKNNSTVHNCLDSDLLEMGEKIRALRESRGMSQERLAECIGVSKNGCHSLRTKSMARAIAGASAPLTWLLAVAICR